MSPTLHKGKPPANTLPTVKGKSPQPVARRALSTAQDSAFLSEIERRNKASREQREALMRKCSKEEIETLQWLEHQFANLEQLFDSLATQQPGWVASQPVGDWLHPNNKRGYSLNTGTEENHKAGAPNPHRWLVVSCTLSDEDNPYHLFDETKNKKPAQKKLLPWRGKAEDKALVPVEKANTNRLLEHNLVISLHHREIGQLHKKIPLSEVCGGNLAPLCNKLFRALMGDNLEKLQQLAGHEPKPKPLLLGFLKKSS